MTPSGGYESHPMLPGLFDQVPHYADRPDVDFYVEMCRRTGGETLELCCGTGRVLIPIAKEGFRITGLDISHSMLRQCRLKLREQLPGPRGTRVHMVQGDMRSFSFAQRFDLIIIPFRSFQHLIRTEDQIACLRCVHAHLKARGLFVLELANTDWDTILDPRNLREQTDIADHDLGDGRRLRRDFRVVKHHRDENYSDVEYIYRVTGEDGRTRRVRHSFAIRFSGRGEIEELLKQCGFRTVEMFGGFDRSAWREDSPEMIFVLRADQGADEE